MSTSDFSYVGLAVLYGVAASFALLGLLRLAGRFPGWHLLPFLGVTLTFLFLTQHPFPAPGSLNCPMAGATPQLRPFWFMDSFWRLNHSGADPVDYLLNRTLAASAMNFLLCAAIGLTLARHVKTWAAIALFGATLTGTIELTQLTGFWGIYPCAYRQFNVDDLLLNLLGVLAGAGVARGWRMMAKPRGGADV